MATSFHLSIAVEDLDAVRAFYTDVLGCEVSHDDGAWINIDLFGHQLTVHQATDPSKAVAIDHFGPMLWISDWQALAERLNAHGVEYLIPPQVHGEGSPDERGKYLIRDPAGNVLEFKYRGNERRPDADNA